MNENFVRKLLKIFNEDSFEEEFLYDIYLVLLTQVCAHNKKKNKRNKKFKSKERDKICIQKVFFSYEQKKRLKVLFKFVSIFVFINSTAR